MYEARWLHRNTFRKEAQVRACIRGVTLNDGGQREKDETRQEVQRYRIEIITQRSHVYTTQAEAVDIDGPFARQKLKRILISWSPPPSTLLHSVLYIKLQYLHTEIDGS